MAKARVKKWDKRGVELEQALLRLYGPKYRFIVSKRFDIPKRTLEYWMEHGTAPILLHEYAALLLERNAQ